MEIFLQPYGGDQQGFEVFAKKPSEPSIFYTGVNIRKIHDRYMIEIKNCGYRFANENEEKIANRKFDSLLDAYNYLIYQCR